MLSNQDFPAIDVYGFTFDLALSRELVDSAFKMTYLENSWLNRDAPYISLAARPPRLVNLKQPFQEQKQSTD
ncbi:MAG: hypothetical protein R2778_03685 [Saprospiraceae bacterium]